MVRDNITILCYWNGRIISGSRGITYEGATPKPIRVSNQMNYNDLVDKMHTITGFSKLQMCIKITCRYPTNFQEYIALPVEDDDTLSIIFDVVKIPEINCLEFYLEATPLSIDEQADVPQVISLGPLTQIITHEIEVGDNNFDLSSGREMQNHGQFGSEQPLDDYGINHINDRESGQQVAAENDGVHPIGNTRNDGLFNKTSTCIMEEIVASEENRFVTNGTQINNELLDDILEEAHEGINEEDINMVYEDAQAPEFISINKINNAVVDVLVSGQEVTRSKDGEELCVGQRFATKDELQNAVKLYSLRVHQQYQVSYSGPNLWVLKCKQAPNCSWRLRASIPLGASFFEIKKYSGPHSCVNPIINRDHVQLDSGFVAGQIKSLVKTQLSITLTAIQAVISEKFNYDISKKKAWKAKQKVIVELFGDWDESYKMLPRFMDVLKKENPGTIVHWHKEFAERNPGHEIFMRVFWSFAASVEGFKYCRPIISIDGTHLYGKYKGSMLIAFSCDANNQLFPLAFAIVEEENTDSWGWFMACIKSFVTQRNGICIISDRHSGIINAVNTIGSGWTEPEAYHRFCIRHLASNFNSKFHDKVLKNLVWCAANENQVRKFDERMETIKRINPEARKWLEDIPLEKWALAHDRGRRHGVMTTSLSEVFNSVLKGARCLPITALVQLTFYRVSSYFAIRRQLGAERVSSGQNFTPFVDARISSNGIKASGHEIVLFDRLAGTFSIKTGRSITSKRKGNNVQVVKLNEKFCSCQKLQIFGFPCSHVMAACQYSSLDYTNLVQNWYSVTTYKMTWAPLLHPIPNTAYWPSPKGMTLLPSFSMKRTTKGRPKSTRLHNEMDVREGRTTIRCSNCKREGHNKKKCPLNRDSRSK